MNRNVESHFGQLPVKSIKRSKLRRDCRHLTSFNTGDIVPIYVDEVLPGDTVSIDESFLVRMTTPIDPVADNAWIDTYYFFVPRRLVWEHWAEFMGENKNDAWTQETEYEIPKTYAPEGGWQKGSIASYMGARINTDDIWMDSCYLRAYALIVNEWFRNQNVSEPAEVSLGDAATTGSNGTDYVVDLQKGGMPAKAVKYADYFTRALPQPQKGPDVYLPLGQTARVTTSTDSEPPTKIPDFLRFYQWEGSTTGWVPAKKGNLGFTESQQPKYNGMAVNYEDETATWTTKSVMPVNLVADLENATAATINQLRQAFAVQRMAEIDARSGTRLIEIIAAHFGVNSPDARMQRPEYLGGKRVPINMTDVVQQSSTDATSPQGNTAGLSKTYDGHNLFTQSFTEHGILMGLAVVRTEHTYQQGMPRILNRENKLDFYWPALSNIGEQYIKNREIYAQGTEEDTEAFGYQEAWAEYRYGYNRVSGELNSDYQTPLDSWHYADDYDQLPTLSHAWVSETKANMARTLAIQDQDQFIADFYFKQNWVRPMPIYSTPSLTSWH